MPAIVLEDLRFSYPPSLPGHPPVQVLRGVSLNVAAGQALAITGPTGCGKTTLALVLAGLAPEMTGGTLNGIVHVGGLDAAHTPAAQLSRHLGLVFQEPERQLFNMTVASEIAFGLETLALPPDQIGRRIAWVLERVGLVGLEERAPWQLSGGQQKRLAIATILAMQPPILVLDEPMAGLDPIGRREVAQVLAELKESTGVTVLVLEKDSEFAARWAERLIVLDEGQIVLDGTPREVFRQTDRLHHIGIAVPQVAELAWRLRSGEEQADFLTAQEAVRSLEPHLKPASVCDPLPEVTRWMPAPPPAVPVAIDLQEVSFTYENGTQALAGLTLAVPRGQFLAIVGPNGSGKSTLARHLNGLLRPQNGSVAIHGQPTAGRSVGELAREVGYVFQNPDHQIFAPTIREEIAFGPRNLGLRGKALGARVDAAMAAFGLADLAETPPAVLGYGVRRLVTLASVWAAQPSIWVLDEPTTGLDARLTGRLLTTLRDLHQAGRTILFITHDLRLVAEVAERVVVLDQGRVALDGSPAEVLADGERLAGFGLRPPPIVRLSGLLARHGFPHPMLTVDDFVQAWRSFGEPRPTQVVLS